MDTKDSNILQVVPRGIPQLVGNSNSSFVAQNRPLTEDPAAWWFLRLLSVQQQREALQPDSEVEFLESAFCSRTWPANMFLT